MNNSLHAFVSSYLTGIKYSHFSLYGIHNNTSIINTENSNIVSNTTYRPPLFVSSYPTEWIDLYFKKKFFSIDPILNKTKQSMIPFLWGEEHSPEIFRNDNDSDYLFRNANDYGIYKGITVPIYDENNAISSMTLTFDKKEIINDTSFFALVGHMNNIGRVCHKLHRFHNGEVILPPDELETISRFLTKSNHSCIAML